MKESTIAQELIVIWRDLVAPMLEAAKQRPGVGDRVDIAAIADLIEFEEGRDSTGG